MSKIKDVALVLFAQNGYDFTPLSAVAEQAGIKTPSIYAHFAGKKDLFLAVFDDVVAELVNRLSQLQDLLPTRPGTG